MNHPEADAGISDGHEPGSGRVIPALIVLAVIVIGLGIYFRGGNPSGFLFTSGGASANVYDGPDGNVVLVESNASGVLEHTRTTYHEALQSEKILLVDFWAPWCGPCRQLAPELDEVIRKAPGKYAIVKVDVDEEPEISADYNVESIPLVVVHRNKAVIGQFGGYMSQRAIEAGLGDLPLDD